MPSVPRPGTKPYYFECPEDLYAALHERCRQTRRSVRAELTLALEHWLNMPLGALPQAPPPSDAPEPAAKGKAKR